MKVGIQTGGQTIPKFGAEKAYEMFRKALWNIAMPNVEADLEEIDDFWEEKTFLDMLQSGGELAWH